MGYIQDLERELRGRLGKMDQEQLTSAIFIASLLRTR